MSTKSVTANNNNRANPSRMQGSQMMDIRVKNWKTPEHEGKKYKGSTTTKDEEHTRNREQHKPTAADGSEKQRVARNLAVESGVASNKLSSGSNSDFTKGQGVRINGVIRKHGPGW